ncbi:unnamed protein product [Clonostachys rosea]|uniref:F-box domain-containing protein n=1 Tax=Bionectria ochroleuca TaxID=29856 RepID=A0ABY6TZ11_BIOOC|nr:unnamed protein product [Clonostachys rosea]
MEQSRIPAPTILRLPDELLAPVLQDSVHVEYETWRDDHSEPFLRSCHPTTARALVSTCRRFYRLVTPLLYANIQIQCNGASDDDGELAEAHRTRLLHRALRTNTSLWPHCRKLEIAFGPKSYTKVPFDRESPVHNLTYVACDCLNWLTNITELCIIGWPQPKVLLDTYTFHILVLPTRDDLLYLFRLAIGNLPRLRHLRLHTYDEAMLALPTLHTGLSGFKLDASLRTLDLSGITHVGTNEDWASIRAQAGTSPLTGLKLRHFTQGLQALEALVLWPAKLTSFDFSLPMSDHYSGEGPLTPYDLGVMQRILSHHKKSLSFIRLQELLHEGLYDFDVTDFHSLKTLSLGHDTTGTDTSSINKLVAPNCDVFCWNMIFEDQQHGEDLGSFAQPEEDWLRAFAHVAIARKSALRHIKVIYYPEPYGYVDFEARKTFEYPWDRMDRLAHEIQTHGISLSYNVPTTSREQFEAWRSEKVDGVFFNLVETSDQVDESDQED